MKQCPECGREFSVLLVTVRAKRGRISRGFRHYILRTITLSGEHVFDFVDASGSDLDLRSRDIAYLCFFLFVGSVNLFVMKR